MPTPARNVDYVNYRPGHLVVSKLYPLEELSRSVHRNVNYEWIRDVKPASGGNPRESKSGWRPCRGWTRSGRRWFYPPNTVRTTIDYGSYGNVYKYEDGSFWGVAPPAMPPLKSRLINEAEVRALNKLKDQDINLGEFLAEWGETERMIADRFRRIARSVRQFRRRNPKKTWQAVRAYERQGNAAFRRKIPSAWLELQYGWNPLLHDVFGAIHQLGKPDREPLIHVKGHASDVDTVTVDVLSVDSNSSAKLECRSRQDVWVSLWYSLNNPGLATQSQLGLLNPLEIVWECLPYSFVVDWAIPVGAWMSSLTADAGFSFKGGSRSTKIVLDDVKVKDLRFWRYSSGGTRGWSEGSGPTLTGSAADFTRTCYLTSPVPGIYVKNPLSALHVANAIALLMQAFH